MVRRTPLFTSKMRVVFWPSTVTVWPVASMATSLVTTMGEVKAMRPSALKTMAPPASMPARRFASVGVTCANVADKEKKSNAGKWSLIDDCSRIGEDNKLVFWRSQGDSAQSMQVFSFNLFQAARVEAVAVVKVDERREARMIDAVAAQALQELARSFVGLTFVAGSGEAGFQFVVFA